MIEATYIDHMGSDLSVVNAARVSFGKRSEWYENEAYGCENYPNCGEVGCHADFTYELYEKDERLIKYLAKHGHISPFGHAFASFHVKAPVFVARQLVKHSYLRWNEVSRRYVDDTPEFYVPDAWRGRSADKKQGSDGVVELEEFTTKSGHYPYDTPEELGLEVYTKLLEQGVAPEQARMVLPQSMMTEWYWSGSLDAFARMCNLRCKPDTQYESQLVANQIDTEMAKLFPVSWEALRSYED
jgi:thymidylate synthase (FAD)